MEEIGYLMIQIFVLFFSAELLGVVFRRLRLPAMIGYIAAGILFVNLCIYTDMDEVLHFNIDVMMGDHSHVINVMGQLGLVFMLFGIGLETKMSELMAIGKNALVTAVVGIIFPFVGGVAVYYLFARDTEGAIMLGTAIFAMSAVVSIQLLMMFGITESKVGRSVIGVAIFSDIICLCLMAVNVALVSPVSQNSVVLDICIIVAFIAFVLFFIYRTGQKKHNVHSFLDRYDVKVEMSNSTFFVIAITVCLFMAALSYVVGLSGIVGAFLAGMFFAEFEKTTHIVEKFEDLVHFMLPFFFIYVGLKLRFDVMTIDSLVMAAVITAVAVTTKYAGGYMGARACKVEKETASFVATCMISRGDIAIVVAALGLSLGLFTLDMYAAVIITALLTQIIAPPLMQRAYTRMSEADPEMVRVQNGGDSELAIGIGDELVCMLPRRE